ncbi:MAG: AzlD domain-containing protein [Salinirussus sp.]
MVPAPDATVIWGLTALLAVGTFLIRLSFIEAFHHLEGVPAGLERALRYVPAAVLAALLVPRVALTDGTVLLGPENEKLLAILPAAIVAWRTDNMLLPVAVGMATLWLLAAV